MELVVLALAAAAAAADPLVVRVNKCCPPHQQLAINMTACLDYKYDVPRAARPAPAPPPLPWWVSGELRVVAPSGQEVGAAEATWLALPGAPPGCPAARRSLLMQHLDQFTVAHDGRLLLYDGDEEPPLQLPPSAFCLDRMEVRQGGEGRLVALACECSAAGTWCWRRCWPARTRAPSSATRGRCWPPTWRSPPCRRGPTCRRPPAAPPRSSCSIPSWRPSSG